MNVGKEAQETKRFDDEKKEMDAKNNNVDIKKNAIMSKSKWTAFDWNESDTNNRFKKLLADDKITDTDWLKWMNKQTDVNMTDTNGRTPLFVCAYNVY